MSDERVNDCCFTMFSLVLLLFIFCFILSKTKNNVKKNLFTSLLVRIRENSQRFVKDCFVIRWIVKIVCDVPDKMAASSILAFLMPCDQAFKSAIFWVAKSLFLTITSNQKKQDKTFCF